MIVSRSLGVVALVALAALASGCKKDGAQAAGGDEPGSAGGGAAKAANAPKKADPTAPTKANKVAVIKAFERFRAAWKKRDDDAMKSAAAELTKFGKLAVPPLKVQLMAACRQAKPLPPAKKWDALKRLPEIGKVLFALGPEGKKALLQVLRWKSTSITKRGASLAGPYGKCVK